ncbi:MAG: hypothetical protein VCE43_19225 [Myxococcota bacterium]
MPAFGGESPAPTSVTAKRRAAITLGLLIGFQLAWGGQYIFRTSFVHSDQRVFSLWDDAMISMQYARNLSNGDGLVWNAGDEPVQGFTNLGVTLTMAALHMLPLATAKIALVFQLLSLCMLTASTALLWGLVRRVYPSEPWVASGAALAIVLCAPLGIWSLQGSDVAFVTLWLAGSAFVIAARSPRTPVLLAVLGSGLWIRPDTAMYYLVLLAAAVVGSRDRRLLPLGLGLLVLTLGAQMGFAQLYYGDFLPNTYYLKATGSPRLLMLAYGLGELLSLLPHLLPAIALAVVALHLERRSAIWLWGALFVVAEAYNVWVGGDFIFGYGSRFVVPALPFLLMLAVIGCWRVTARLLAERSPAQVSVFASGVVAMAVIANPLLGTLEWFNPIASTMHRDTNRNNYNFARYLRLHTDKSVTLAVHWGGVPVYFSGRKAFDVLGKSDRHIARLEVDHFYPGHSKWDWDYVLAELRPDVFRAPSRGLGERADFQRDYLKVETTHNVNFFLRRNRAAKLYDPDAVLVDLISGQRMRPRPRAPIP